MLYRFTILFLLVYSVGTLKAQRTDTVRYFFDIDKTQPINQPKLPDADSIAQMQVIGYADYLGTNAYNKQLSFKRATRVAQLLRSKNLPVNKITGKGALPEISTNQEIGVAENRRVDVVYSLKQKKLAATDSSKINTSESALDTLHEGQSIVLENLKFQGGRHFLKENSLEALDVLEAALRKNPSLRILLEGHICCGAQLKPGLKDGLDMDTGEFKLSENRAEYIKSIMVNRGISADRIETIGYGPTKPLIDPERTDEDRQKNRRVEVKILSR